jgi:hypothetical protein
MAGYPSDEPLSPHSRKGEPLPRSLGSKAESRDNEGDSIAPVAPCEALAVMELDGEPAAPAASFPSPPIPVVPVRVNKRAEG